VEFEKLKELALECGFSNCGPLEVAKLELREEVREMCKANSCGQYGKRWSCPPGCGELEDMRKELLSYSRGILVQTTGELEDEFDGEAMMETEAEHKEHLFRMRKELSKYFPRLLTAGAGCCTVCRKCTYPEEPCRFPDKKIVSMEAYGMLVLEVCKKNDLQYYYGPNTITYTSCFLLD